MKAALWMTAALIAACAVLCPAPHALAQDARPASAIEDESAPDPLGRRPMSNEPTVLAFKDVAVEDIVPFIVESTGKVVLPQALVLSRRVTIINDRPIPRSEALDYVFLALYKEGVGVIEQSTMIVLRDIAEIDRESVPVLGPEVSTLDRPNIGTIAQKVYALQYASAENLGEVLEEEVPDGARLAIDTDSNQVVLTGPVALLQQVERLILSLDRPNAATLATETYSLRYADAEQIAENIRELYGEEGSGGSSGSRGGNSAANNARTFFAQIRGTQSGRSGNTGRGGQNNAGSTSSAATSENLRVTANTQQNSVTVLAEPRVLEQIREQIGSAWDLPLPDEAVVPRIYDLENSDPVKVRDLLEELFSEEATGQTESQGVGRLAGQFSFEAIPESGRLVVVSKSPDNLKVIDDIVADLDRPQTAGLPAIVELKHASAEELAEQLNALLAEEGTLAQINRAESGLSETDSTSSPFATDATNTNNGNQDTGPGVLTFWWQRARPPTDSAGSSNLVAKIRIVPVWRQNALMVMSPPEYQTAILSLIDQLDQPGRQVLISAIVAEVALEDATSLGLRWSSSNITPTLADNSLGVGADFTGSQDDLIGALFNTSVLDVGVDINVLLQALNEKTAINILSEPRIFTSDNQEAEFFDGQDIPFVTDSQTTDTGNVIDSFDYRAVGIQLRVRPRITVNKDVDLRINLELSSIQPQATLFGGFIVDRRETTTHLIVRDRQTVVISGILRSEESDIKRKVPLLGDIPLIGRIFRSTETQVTNTELIAFITPIVVVNPEETEEVNRPFNERLERMRDQMDRPGEDDELLEADEPEDG